MEEPPLTSSLRTLFAEVDALSAERHVQFMRDFGVCLKRHEQALMAVASSTDLLGATTPVLGQQQQCPDVDVPTEALPMESSGSSATADPTSLAEIQWAGRSQTPNLSVLRPQITGIGEEAKPCTFSADMRAVREELLKKGSKESPKVRSPSVSSTGAAPVTLRQWISSPRFDLLMSSIMITNIVFFGVQVEHMAATMQEDPPTWMKLVSWGYTFLFMLELIIRMAAIGIRNFFSHSWGWNMVDVFAVLVSCTEAMIEIILAPSGANKFSQVRLLRMFRMARLLRMVRLVRYFRSLRILIDSVINTLRSLVWTFTLMAIILYSFGLLFTQHATQARIEKREDVDPMLIDFFGNLLTSIYTLFLCVTAGLEWNEPAEPLRRDSPLMLVLLLIFIAWYFFAVMNVITGVVCQSAIEAAQSDHEMVISENMSRKSQYTSRLKELFHAMDADQTDVITLDEFESCMKEKWFKAYFDSIDITVGQAFQVFKLLDAEHTGELDMEAFVTGCLRLRGSATTCDMALLLQESRWNMQRVMESETKSQAKLDLVLQRLWEQGAAERSDAERESQAKLDLLQWLRERGAGESAPAERFGAQQGPPSLSL